MNLFLICFFFPVLFGFIEKRYSMLTKIKIKKKAKTKIIVNWIPVVLHTACIMFVCYTQYASTPYLHSLINCPWHVNKCIILLVFVQIFFFSRVHFIQFKHEPEHTILDSTCDGGEHFSWNNNKLCACVAIRCDDYINEHVRNIQAK